MASLTGEGIALDRRQLNSPFDNAIDHRQQDTRSTISGSGGRFGSEREMRTPIRGGQLNNITEFETPNFQAGQANGYMHPAGQITTREEEQLHPNYATNNNTHKPNRGPQVPGRRTQRTGSDMTSRMRPMSPVAINYDRHLENEAAARSQYDREIN